MTIENIENHMAYTCKCGGVNFALLKYGAIECNKCSTPLDGVKWWAGGMGAQLARAVKAEAERDALKAALPVGELTTCNCRWDADDNRVATCARHQGWLDVVSEWAERAKAAEKARRE